jgi:formylglycine-generating enzyme required for sulfatase activity
MPVLRIALLTASLLALTGCWSVRAPGGAADAGTAPETGPTSDSGVDGTVPDDAGMDGSIDLDAGPTSDGGMGEDGGRDAGLDGCRILDPRARSCPGGGTGCAQRVVVVPGARDFEVGREADDYGERPVANVPALAPFELEIREVTVDRFRRWVAADRPIGTVTFPDGQTVTPTVGDYTDAARNGDCTFNGSDEMMPMNCVSWDAALAFCAWDVPGGRLPTDVEYEFVARWWNATAAGTPGRVFPWGSDSSPQCGFANVQGCERPRQLMRVAQLAPAQCLYDLGGNVAEWTADTIGAASNPASLRPACWGASPWRSPLCQVPVDDFYVVRGGAWNDDPGARWLQTSARGAVNRFSTRPADGFRCARSAPMP